MLDIPIRERKYNVFISYAHEDATFANTLANWLASVAGLSVWIDERRLKPGSTIATTLPKAISQAASAIFVLSSSSADSGWVEEEYSAAINQRTKYHEYRIVALRLDDTEPPDLLQNTTFIDAFDRELSPTIEISILSGLYSDDTSSPHGSRDIYISRSWRTSEAPNADAVCRLLIDSGYRLIGDATDQQVFDSLERVPALIGSCGALVAIAPNRDGRTSPYIEQEINIALQQGICCLVIEEPGLSLNPAIIERIDREYHLTIADVAKGGNSHTFLDVIREGYIRPQRPHYCFYATSLIKSRETTEQLAQLIESITGIECFLGQYMTGRHIQAEIIERIRGALFVIADVSEHGVNPLIEAGIALGAGVRLHLIAEGEPRPSRFMFRDREMHFYRNEQELIGKLHRISRPYRRRILNRELQRRL